MDEISFSSDRDRCAAWYFNANGDPFATVRGLPCVVMAPGFAGTRDTSALIDYARGFAAAGLDVVLFDYRGSGGSRACMTVAGTPLNEPRSISCARRAATARSPRSRPKPTSCTR